MKVDSFGDLYFETPTKLHELQEPAGKINPKYNKLVPKNCKFIDVYRVLHMFEVTDPCVQHAVKKLLAAGDRGHKDVRTDIDEAIQSLHRYRDMRDEEL